MTAPDTAAPFFRGLAFGLIGGLAAWAVIALVVTLAWLA